MYFLFTHHTCNTCFILLFPTYYFHKALFGDAHTHKDSTVPQAESYIHRFGPGLLLYWFGHAPHAAITTSNDLMVTGWTLPDQWLLPTGEVIAYPAT